MANLFAHMFDEHGLLKTSTIDAYVQGKLNAAETRAFEEHISENEFEADAVEGYILAKQTTKNAPQYFGNQQQKRGLVVSIKKYAKPLAAVAGLALLVGVSYAVFNKEKQQQITKATTVLPNSQGNLATDKVNEYDVKKQDVPAITSTESDKGKPLPSATNKTITVKQNDAIIKEDVTTNIEGIQSGVNNNSGNEAIAQEPKQVAGVNRPQIKAVQPQTVAATPPPIAARADAESPSNLSQNEQTSNYISLRQKVNTAPSAPSSNNYTGYDNNSMNNNFARDQVESKKIGPSYQTNTKKRKGLDKEPKRAIATKEEANTAMDDATPANNLSNYYTLYRAANYQAALKMLQSIVVDRNNINEIQLETARCFIKLNNKAKAQQILNSLIENNASNKNQAKDLLNSIK
jgi:hypothetical protein